MKWIKPYNIFESLRNEINIEDIEERLIDFKHIGFDTDINLSSSIILDFDKKDDFHIKVSEIDDFNSGTTNNSLTIQFHSGQYIQCNVDELETIGDDLSHYLNETLGLIPNYIYFGNIDFNFNTRAIYFKDFKSLRKYLNLRAGANIDPENIKTSGFTIGYYK